MSLGLNVEMFSFSVYSDWHFPIKSMISCQSPHSLDTHPACGCWCSLGSLQLPSEIPLLRSPDLLCSMLTTNCFQAETISLIWACSKAQDSDHSMPLFFAFLQSGWTLSFILSRLLSPPFPSLLFISSFSRFVTCSFFFFFGCLGFVACVFVCLTHLV